MMEDAEAIARLQQGDLTGLDALVQHHQRSALRIAYLICRDSTLSEDIVQTAFVRLYERIGRFDNARPFGSWFLRGIINDALMATRRRHIS
jgi:RNA polymerase sigma-70 factor, ECF subfamily